MIAEKEGQRGSLFKHGYCAAALWRIALPSLGEYYSKVEPIFSSVFEIAGPTQRAVGGCTPVAVAVAAVVALCSCSCSCSLPCELSTSHIWLGMFSWPPSVQEAFKYSSATHHRSITQPPRDTAYSVLLSKHLLLFSVSTWQSLAVAASAMLLARAASYASTHALLKSRMNRLSAAKTLPPWSSCCRL